MPRPAKMPTLKQVEKAINIPATEWPNRCHEIAVAVVSSGVIPGADHRYGKYYGPISDDSIFAGHPLSRHGWVVLPDGGILDPTRWVFEAVKPYLAYFAADAEEQRQYDVAGNRTERMFSPDLAGPPPSFNDTEKVYDLVFPDDDTEQFVRSWFGRTQLCFTQMHWLAHRTAEELGEYGRGVFQALKDSNLKAWIPIDNWYAVMGEYS